MENSVFFQGSLQDGISLAIQQSKMVLAFVTDGGDESEMWENELLTNTTLKAPLESKAVSLRLPAGSQEAGFLEALFPVPKKPTVVIIQNGTLKEYIRGGGPGGSSKEDLVNRIAKILTPPAPAESGAQPTTSSSAGRTLNQGPATPASQAPASTRNSVTDDLYDDYDDVPAPVSSSAPTGSSGQPQQSPQVQALLAERAKRLEADKKAKAKAEKDARAKARQEANEAHEGQSSNANPAGKSYAEEIRQKKIQAAEERKRILKRIEDDKQERKEREAQERQARLLLSATQDGEGPSYQAPPIPLPRIQGGAKGGDRCNLQIRLFDGSTIRTQFKSDATLSKDVRDWIDEDRTDGDAPYTFRIVLTPLPNKAIEPAEESESLLSLGLAPSATLVLVPSKHALAYTRSNGFIWQTLAYILGIFGAGYGLITSVFGGFTGMFSGRGGNRQEGIAMQNLAGGRSASRIRGFQNADDQRRDAQLYNGNSLNFEPRRDDEDEDNDGR